MVLFQKWVPVLNRLSGGKKLFLLNTWFRLETQQNSYIYPVILQSLNGFNELLPKQCQIMGHLGGSAVERLPLALGDPRSWDPVPHQAPCEEPAVPSASVSVCLS